MSRSCPVCGQPVSWEISDDRYPFCSRRCRTIDLGEWLSDGYRISEALQDPEGGLHEEAADLGNAQDL